ncbi:MAG: cellulase family glycosylhydrolase [Christensenellales bacterium]|nr:cellulase family glycosylhydrolase [Christensenellales bacterium]
MKITRFFVVLLICLSVSLGATGYAATSDDGMLRTSGKNIVNAKGEVVQLRGVNAGGWLVQESWLCLTNADCQLKAFETLDSRFGRATRDYLFDVYEDNYWTEADFDNVKALGMNVIRLPITWWHILNEDGNLRSDAFDRIDWFVNCCEARDLYVVIDLHAAPGSQNGKDHSGDTSGSHLWENSTYQDRTVALWQHVANHYKGNATVAAYDLLNEPGGDSETTTSMQWNFFDRLYDAIRAIDPDHIIMMESCWAPNNLPHPNTYGWENVVYQYHYYTWGADNDYAKQKAAVDSNLSKLKNANYPVPTYIGELTLFQNEDAWRYALNAYSDAGLSWTIWNFKATGENSTWGLYNILGDKADLNNDSAERIAEIWANQGTLKRNDWLCDIVSSVLSSEKTPIETLAGMILDNIQNNFFAAPVTRMWKDHYLSGGVYSESQWEQAVLIAIQRAKDLGVWYDFWEDDPTVLRDDLGDESIPLYALGGLAVLSTIGMLYFRRRRLTA